MSNLLHFNVHGISCAIRNDCIQFVIQMVALENFCGPEEEISGIVNIEGFLHPVYPVWRLLGLGDRSPRTSDVLIIARAGAGTVALEVDEISGVRENPDHGISHSGTITGGLQVSTEGLIIIEDLPALLEFQDRGQIRAILPPSAQENTIEQEASVQARGVLEQRAKKMARPVKKKETAVLVEVLKFRLANQEYALTMDHIREVILTGEITPVPGTPPYITGICAIRGEIISLVDLREFFSIRGTGLTDLNRVIVITDGQITFGILSDAITGIGMITRDTLAPVCEGLTPIAGHFILGAVDDLIILNGGALLTDPSMVVDDMRP